MALIHGASRRNRTPASGVDLRADSGTTLIELIVGMTILSIFLGMFTGAVVMLNQATNKAQAINLTATQLNGAFLTLDRTVRYASAISTPGCAGTSALDKACDSSTPRVGDWYVELRNTTTTGSEVCTQLRVDIALNQLQKRSWDPANLPAVAPAFTAVASGITNGAVAKDSPNQPFVTVPLGATVPYQQLSFNFLSLTGTGPSATTSRSSFTFGALNSSVPAPAAQVCQQEGRP